jgi:hypothetical protein
MAMIYTRFIRINKKILLLRAFTRVSLRTTPDRDLFPITYPSSFRKASAYEVFGVKGKKETAASSQKTSLISPRVTPARSSPKSRYFWT